MKQVSAGLKEKITANLDKIIQMTKETKTLLKTGYSL